jgi:hypothetical protein
MTDRFSKRNVMVISKFFELISMLLGIYFLLNLATLGVYPILITLFLMATPLRARSKFSDFLPKKICQRQTEFCRC